MSGILNGGRAVAETHRDALSRRLIGTLNAPEMLAQLNTQFVHPMLQPHPIASITDPEELEFSDFSLGTDQTYTGVSLEKNLYTVFTIAGPVSVVPADGSRCQADIYRPKAAIAHDVPMGTELRLAGDVEALTISEREIFRRGVIEHPDRDRIAATVYELITTRPNAELAYALDERLRIADFVYEDRELPAGYTADYRITGFEITELTPSYVKAEEDYVAVKIEGGFSVEGHPDRYEFTTFLCLSLVSLQEGDCKLVINRHCDITFRLPTFAFEIAMDRSEFPFNGGLVLHFTVTNLLPKKNVFLIWHTPLEGFRNEFLKIVHVASGDEICYEGIHAGRVPPSRDSGSCIELAAGTKKSATIDLREAYTFARPGRYRVTFVALGGVRGEAAVTTEFLLAPRSS